MTLEADHIGNEFVQVINQEWHNDTYSRPETGSFNLLPGLSISRSQEANKYKNQSQQKTRIDRDLSNNFYSTTLPAMCHSVIGNCNSKMQLQHINQLWDLKPKEEINNEDFQSEADLLTYSWYTWM